MNLLIREACVTDAAPIVSLTVEGIKTWGGDILDKLAPWTEQICNRTHVEQRLHDANYRSFVAEQNNKVVGSVYLNIEDADTAHIGGLYCSVKRCGVGSTLLRKAMSEAKNLRYTRVKCEIYSGNEASIALMTKHGAVYSHSELYDDVEYQTYIIPL